MCSEPKIIDGYEVSCRECNQCCATYKNTWVARCIAEMQMHPEALAFTLTYADVKNADGELVLPLGAKVFRYKDVQDFFKRLRYHGRRTYGPAFVVRYVVVGEKGTRKGRCHYHGVLFSNFPIKDIGVFTDGKGKEHMPYKTRLNWTTWGHGFVEMQRADRKGISYALKYILKARMTAARSKGTQREGKTEWLASSYLWCSKVPAIGAGWLFNQLDAMVSRRRCPPSLRITVPSGGDWYVNGELQHRVCVYLKEHNDRVLAETGRNLAGWQALVESVSKPITLESGETVPRKAWEFLTYGEEQGSDESEADTEALRIEYKRDADALVREFEYRRAATINASRAAKCFGVRACTSCQRFRSEQQRIEDAQSEKLWREAYQRYKEVNRLDRRVETFETWIIKQGLVAEGCSDRLTSKFDFAEKSEEHRRANERFEHLQRSSNF